ncbi:unnamed protein product [Sphagnum balticum]
MGDLKCVVTGGRGLVGRHLVLKLLKEEKISVTVADIGPEIEVCAEEEEEGTLGVALESGKVEYVCVDVRSKRELVEIFRDVVVVFHTADMESFVDNFQLHYDVTVSWTRNVIDMVRPGGMEKPTDAFKETHNLGLYRKDSLSGGQVSRLQVAELIACCVSNPDLSKNKVLEAIAETTMALRPIEELL